MGWRGWGCFRLTSRTGWAWPPSLQLSSASALQSPAPSGGFDLDETAKTPMKTFGRLRNPTQNSSNDVIKSFLVSTPTLCYLQLPLSIPQSREQVQLDPGLSAQAVLQVLGLLLHRRQSWHQNFRVFLILLILPQLLGRIEMRRGLLNEKYNDKRWTTKAWNLRNKTFSVLNEAFRCFVFFYNRQLQKLVYCWQEFFSKWPYSQDYIIVSVHISFELIWCC